MTSSAFDAVRPNTFAAACYDQNSIADLEHALTSRRADRADMAAWGLAATEWRSQIRLALAALRERATA